MSFYSEVATEAASVIAEFGATCTLTTDETGAYDPEEGSAPIITTSHPCSAAVFPVERQYLDGTTILATDQQALVSVVGLVEPKPGDRLTFNGVVYQLLRAMILGPAGIAVLYTIFIRA